MKRLTGDVLRRSSSKGCCAGPYSENPGLSQRRRRPDIWSWSTVRRRVENRRTSPSSATISLRRGGHFGPSLTGIGSASQLKETMSVDRAGQSSTISRAGTDVSERRRYRIDGSEGMDGNTSRARLAIGSKFHNLTMRRRLRDDRTEMSGASVLV